MCCRVNRCCFCVDLLTGVKALAVAMMAVEVCIIVVGTLRLPEFLFAIAPTNSIGIICDVLLLVAAFRTARWFTLPWLIYAMILIVGLGLAAVLRIVITLGSVGRGGGSGDGGPTAAEWGVAAATSVGCLAAAGILLYFWIVVLELFIRLGPPPGLPVPPIPPAAATAAATGYFYDPSTGLQQPAVVQLQPQYAYQPAAVVYQAYPPQQQQQPQHIQYLPT